MSGPGAEADPEVRRLAGEILRGLSTASDRLSAASGAAEDCLCAALDRIAERLNPLRVTVGGEIVRLLTDVRRRLTVAGAAALGAAGSAIESAGVRLKEVEEAASEADSDGFYDPETGQTPPFGAGRQQQQDPALDGPPGPDRPFGPGRQLRQDLEPEYSPDLDRTPRKDTPLPGSPVTGDLEPEREDLWRVWVDGSQCAVTITGPGEGPGGGAWVLSGEFEDAGSAGKKAAELKREYAYCPPAPDRPTTFLTANPWSRPEACRAMEGELQSAASTAPAGMSQLFGLRSRSGGETLPPGLTDWTLFSLPIGKFAGALFRALTDAVDEMVRAITGASTGPRAASVLYSLSTLPARLLQRWTGLEIPSAYRPAEMNAAYLDPTELPSPEAAAGAWAAGQIDEETALCWARTAGRLPEPYRRQLYAAASRWSPADAVALERRGVRSRLQTDAEIRAGGWVRPTDSDGWRVLTEQIPPLSDLIRMMVRDAGDDDLARRFGMDEDFEKKWSGKLAEFGQWQGIHPEYARLAWRAHWSIPSPTQLAEFWHRFRHRDPKDPAYVSREDIETALVQQDILPFWIPRFLEASFRPLTRVDTQRAYQIGAIGRAEVLDSYLAQGYSDRDAERMTEYTVRLVTLRAAKSDPVKSYLRGEIGEQELRKALLEGGWPPEAASAAADRAVAARKNKVRTECIRAIRKRFLRGEYSPIEALGELGKSGVEIGDAGELVRAWTCQRGSTDRRVAAGELARWYREGLLNLREFRDRLLRLGYTFDDAERLIASQDLRIAEAARRAAEAEAKAAARRPGAGGGGRDPAEAQRRRAERDRIAEEKARKRAEDSRRRRLARAAVKWQQKRGLGPEEAAAEVDRAYRAARKIAGEGGEEASVLAAETAVREWGPEDGPLAELAARYVRAARPLGT